MSGMSVRAYAKHRKVTHRAVQKAIATGRLKDSIGYRGGKPYIKDVTLADREWRENASRTPPAAAKSSARQSKPAEEETGITLTEATRLVTIERQRKLQMENEVASGRLLDKNHVVKEAFESARIIREGLLNLPARLAGELAAESDASKVFAKLDDALREALTATADTLDATVNQ